VCKTGDVGEGAETGHDSEKLGSTASRYTPSMRDFTLPLPPSPSLQGRAPWKLAGEKQKASAMTAQLKRLRSPDESAEEVRILPFDELTCRRSI
jgi:hypothetical protein